MFCLDHNSVRKDTAVKKKLKLWLALTTLLQSIFLLFIQIKLQTFDKL